MNGSTIGISADTSSDTIPLGSSGGKSVTEEENNDASALCEILKISTDGENITLKFDSCDYLPEYPAEVKPSQPIKRSPIRQIVWQALCPRIVRMTITAFMKSRASKTVSIR